MQFLFDGRIHDNYLMHAVCLSGSTTQKDWKDGREEPDDSYGLIDPSQEPDTSDSRAGELVEN